MDSITPNKEIIRRICILNGGLTCYISHAKGEDFIEVLTDVNEDKLALFATELKEWSGVNYKIYNLNKTAETSLLKRINKKILPIKY